jgi:hypothetical protein
MSWADAQFISDIVILPQAERVLSGIQSFVVAAAKINVVAAVKINAEVLVSRIIANSFWFNAQER